ncbi:MAG: hypothetical protein M3Y50_12140 [Acidobacteriota bacterium]|nr:hypothetical protein [Acidobacteriota bacterium]
MRMVVQQARSEQGPNRRVSIAIVGVCIAWLAMTAASVAQNKTMPAAASDCQAMPQESYPQAAISNGDVHAMVYLPDAKNGYYRATRFDWSGVVRCLSYKGHTYFGQWFPRYNPLAHDSITGPVEEFKGADGALLYAEAKPGELFVKPGVGVLRRVDDSPYSSYFTYPLVDAGKWTVHTSGRGVVFTQRLQTRLGIGYVYRKNLSLDKQAPVLLLEHELKNTGTKAIEMDVYDHDFFMLDGAATGPGIVVHFPFEPKAETPLTNGGKITGNDLTFEQELEPRKTVQSILTGYSDKVSDYDFTVENRDAGIGVEQTGDAPITHFNFWSIHTTVCPEAYIHLNVAPGQTVHWTIRYRFYEK